MSKLYSALAILIVAMSLTQFGWANPCRSIAKACMAEGYYKGGDRVGKGLVKNCVMPVVSNKMTLPASFSESTLQRCKMMIMQKMEQN